MVLVVLLAHALSQLTWLLLPVSEQALPPLSVSATATQATTDYRQIARQHLFGQADKEVASTAAPTDAPDTRLNLTLRGILFNTRSDLARAIISAPGKDDEGYHVGSRLPGGATIDQIYADRVMLLRNGQYEMLRLPEETIAESRGAEQRNARRSTRGSGTASGMAAVRQEIIKNPQRVAEYIQGEPVNRAGGGIAGFRVFAGQNRAVFDQSELEEGDIVTNVNGVQLDGLDKAAEAMEQLSSSNAVTITVLRDGAEHTLQIQVQN